MVWNHQKPLIVWETLGASSLCETYHAPLNTLVIASIAYGSYCVPPSPLKAAQTHQALVLAQVWALSKGLMKVVHCLTFYTSVKEVMFLLEFVCIF